MIPTTYPTVSLANAALVRDWRAARAAALAESRAWRELSPSRSTTAKRQCVADVDVVADPPPTVARLQARRRRPAPFLDIVETRRGWVARHRGRRITGHAYLTRFEAQRDHSLVLGFAAGPEAGPGDPPVWDPYLAAIDELIE